MPLIFYIQAFNKTKLQCTYAAIKNRFQWSDYC